VVFANGTELSDCLNQSREHKWLQKTHKGNEDTHCVEEVHNTSILNIVSRSWLELKEDSLDQIEVIYHQIGKVPIENLPFELLASASPTQ